MRNEQSLTAPVKPNHGDLRLAIFGRLALQLVRGLLLLNSAPAVFNNAPIVMVIILAQCLYFLLYWHWLFHNEFLGSVGLC